jgi:hypothetical protein
MSIAGAAAAELYFFSFIYGFLLLHTNALSSS